MKRAIVSGATGFVGVHLVKELIRRGADVIALVRSDSVNINRLPDSATIIKCNMDEYDRLAERISGEKPDVFFHLAWEGSSFSSRTDALLQAQNAQHSLSAMKAAKLLGCTKFVATGTVYENFNEQISAASSFHSISYYVLSKKYANNMSLQQALHLEIELAWCTFCQPIGRYIDKDRVFCYAVNSLLAGKPPVFGPANNWFDVVDVEDLAVGLFLAGEQKLTKSEYYIGSGKARLLRDYLTELPQILDVKTSVLIGRHPDDGLRFDPEWFNSEPFFTETGFVPRYGFSETVQRLRDYITGNNGG